MIEQVGNAIKFLAFYTASKQGKTGLTVTVDIYNPAGTQVVTGGSATAIGGGLYSYTLASGSVATEGEYAAIFKTADATVDQQHIPALWVVGRAGIEDLDATISSRSTYAGADTAGTATLLTRLTTGRATNLDNLDVAVSTRSTLAAADVWAVGTRTLTAFGFSVTVGTNNDKTGYSLTQVFPANFAALVISAGGIVSANAVAVEGQTLSAVAGDNFNTFFQNAGAATVKVVDDVGAGAGGGTADWTSTERAQIRLRLGLDGTTATPTATPTLPVTVADKTGFGLAVGSIASATFATGATLPRVTLVDTLTTYTGNTPQSGDAFGRIGAGGAGLTALGDTRLGGIGGDTPGTTTLLARLTGTRAGLLDNLDAAVTSRLAAASYTAPANPTDYARNAVAPTWYAAAPTPPTVTQIRQEIDANSTKLDVAVSTRLATAGYTAPSTATQVRDAILAGTPTPRDVSAVTTPTVADCLVAAFAGTAGRESVSGTTYIVRQPDGTAVFRMFALDSAGAPTSRS